MLRLSSLTCELRRWITGALLSIPLVAAGAPQETLLPPQNIPLSPSMRFDKLVVADVNGDHYDDIVAIGTDTDGAVIDVYLNEGKPRRTDEAVTFIRQRLILTGRENTDASIDHVKFSGGSDVQVVDLDNDGNPDLLASDALSGEIFVIWNQGTNAPAPFVFVPDTSDPTAPSMTFFSQLAQRGSFGPVLGTPIYVVAADLKDGSGRKSIVAYHGGLQPDPAAKDVAPFDRRNYEALGIIYPTGSGRAFDIVKQRDQWPGCDMALGSTTCASWTDNLAPNTQLYNFRVGDENSHSNLNFADAPSDILAMDGWTTMGTQQYYKPGVYRPNASPGLQLLPGRGPNGSDAVWMTGAQQVHEFVASSKKFMRETAAINTVFGNERSAGATLGTLSTGDTVLITAGGMRVLYDPTDTASSVNQTVPEYLNRPGQVGGWLNWAPMNTGSALLSLSDYCRKPDPCAGELAWYHAPLNGTPPPDVAWGWSPTLVMLDFAKESTTSSGTQFDPFFQNPDGANFQAFSIEGGSLTHKPFIASGHFASPTESALVMLDHADGSTNPQWNYLALYRPDTAKTYASPTPHLDGLTVGRFIEEGLADIGNTLPKGELSAVLVGTRLGTDTADRIRYVTVHDKASGAMKGIFPVDPAEGIKELSGKDGVVVAGLSTLAPGSYTLEAHNATAVASMNLNVVNPYGITTTDYDWRAGSACGFLPNTKDAQLWPKQIAVAVTDFPSSVQSVRWINQEDGSVVTVGAEGATYDAASSTVTLIVPQGKLTDGRWKAAIQAGGIWQPIKRIWNVTHDSAALAFCASQINFVNEEAYAQCTDKDYYLDTAQYAVWPHLINGSFRFFGSGFAQNNVQSVAIKQSGHRYFSKSIEVVNDNEVHAEFGELSTQLTADVETDLYFYPQSGDLVEAQGIPAVGNKVHWRTPRTGFCVPNLPEIGTFLNTGSGTGGAWQSGDVIKVTAKNALYPVPGATKLMLKGGDGSLFMLENPRLSDDWFEHHYDNDNLVLYFTVPDDLSVARVAAGSGGGATEYGTGLVVVETRALATTAISNDALAFMMAESSLPLAAVGATTTGALVYTGVIPQTWVTEQLHLLTKKLEGTGWEVDIGHIIDNQPQPAESIFAIAFVSQPALFEGNTGPLDYVLVRSRTATEGLLKARNVAIPQFMATNYFTTGGVVSIPPFPPLPSSNAAAGDTGMQYVGPAGTNPRGVSLQMGIAQYSIHIECGILPPIDSFITAQGRGDVNATLRTSLLWRRSVMTHNNPPIACGDYYLEQIGNFATGYFPGTYTTTDKNDYTRF